jgi:putative DNA primase/helicase
MHQSVKLEEAVLGAMMVSDAAVVAVNEAHLGSNDFAFDRHVVIFDAIDRLHRDGKPTDELSVSEELTACGRLKEVGGRDRLAELVGRVPAVGNAGHYAERLRGITTKRVSREIGLRLAEGLDTEAAIEELRRIQDHGAGLENQIATIVASDVSLRVPKFLDAAHMLPTRSITVVFGPAGLGKTVYSMSQCAAVTRGRMTGLDGPAPVLISSLEDDPGAVLGPRLVAADADRDLVHFVSGLSLPSQIPALAAKAKAIGAALVLIDPIAAHLDADIDSHRDASTRAAMAPLAEVAQQQDLTVLIVAHPNKATSATGLNRISGSGAFGNAARSVIVFGLDPGDPDGETGSRRIIAHLKCNIGKRASSVCAELETTAVQTEDGEAQVPKLVIRGLSDHSADDVLGAPTGEERTERDAARDFLEDVLSGGPVRSNEIKAAAEQNGHSWRTIERAKRDLEIKPQQASDGWYWPPPGQNDLGAPL